MCQVTISRFYRDKLMFAFLSEAVLPALAHQAITQGRDQFKVWSLGCGSGEEAYTLALIWQLQWHFDLLRCRNLVFTYFEPSLQQRILQQLLLRIYPGGVLVIGIHEQLPKLTADLTEWSPRLRIYRKSDNQ